MDDLKRFLDNDRLAKHLGIEVIETAPGRARGRMTIRAHHLNSAGIIHGGAVFSLADAVFAAASNSHGTLAVAINVSISYFKAIRRGTLIAEAEEAFLNPKLATYVITVRDEAGDRIALFQGTVYRKRETLAEALGTERESIR
jgi:acyl-CoA thioesterase